MAHLGIQRRPAPDISGAGEQAGAVPTEPSEPAASLQTLEFDSLSSESDLLLSCVGSSPESIRGVL